MALTQVKSDGIATGAVTATQIATGAVTANDLEDSGVTAGTYGSSSAIPAITVDAKGRITSASTNSVTQVGGANGVDFNDNVKARFGTGNDLEIYSDGEDGYIVNSSRHLYIRNNSDDRDIYIQTDDGSGGTTNYMYCNGSAGNVVLLHNGSEKFTTISTGINVTGSVTCDGITIDGSATIAANEGILTIKDNNSTGNSTVCYIRGDDSAGNRKWFIGDLGNSNADVYLSNDQSGGNLYFRTGASERAYFTAADGHFVPYTNNAHDLGTSSLRWRNVYTNDLNLSNEGGTNDVDGTWGSWTIQEGEDDLFLLNRRNGKKYKFNLTEVN